MDESISSPIQSLARTPVEIVHQAFIEAFFDYEVQIKLSLEKFLEMITTRDLNLEYSLGYFEQKRLVSFIICGYREIAGVKYCYDGGTGTVKDFRRKGIGTRLLTELIRVLKQKGIYRFILEVLEHNQAAIDLYLKHGFQKNRYFKCYECPTNQIKESTANHLLRSEDISGYLNLDTSRYLSFQPSWQNDKISVVNSLGNYEYIALFQQDEVIGYGLIHKVSGDIPQLGILKEWRDRNLEPQIIQHLARRTQSERLVLLNIPENDYLESKLIEIGFRNFINQYEMILDLVECGCAPLILY